MKNPGPQAHLFRGRGGLMLLLLTMINAINFWHRNIFYNLAAATPPACEEACLGSAFVPLCEACADAHGMGGDTDAAALKRLGCIACQECRRSHDAEFYSLQVTAAA